MSWQAYIDTSLVGTGNVDSAAIFSADGKDNWARSADFKVTPDEMKVIVNGLADPTPLYASGFHIDGVKYTIIQASDTTIRGKQGKNGLVIVKTKQALLLAHHPESVTTNNCVNTVEALAEYLVSQNY
jgi:profilin